MKRLWFLTAISALMIILSSCGSANSITTTKPAAKTQWDAVLSAIRPDGTVSVETALQAFSVAIAPLQGVALPAGIPVHLPSGSLAIDMVMRHWQELPASRQQEILTILTPSSQSSASASSRYAVVGLSQRASGPPTAQDLLTRALLAWKQIGTHLSRNALIIRVIFDKTIKDAANSVVFDNAGNLRGTADHCDITVNPSVISDSLLPYTPIDLQILMTHEVFHCFQWTVDPQHIRQPPAPWITEGQATWAAFEITGYTYQFPDSLHYTPYIQNPQTPLFQRKYDAVGFYDHMKQQGIDVWSKIDPMLLAPSNEAAFAVAVPAGVRSAFLYSWGSSFFRHPSYGADWDMQGVGVTPATAPIAIGRVSSGGATITIKALDLSSTLYQIGVSSDVEVIHFVSVGYVRLHDSGSVDTGDQGPAKAYSLAGHPNTCPSDTPDAGDKLPTLSGPIALAVTGDEMGSGVEITAEKLQDACKKKNLCPPAGMMGAVSFSPEMLRDDCGTLSASDIYQKAVEAASKLKDASFHYVTVLSAGNTTADGVLTRTPLRMELTNEVVTTDIGSVPAPTQIYDGATGLLYLIGANGVTTISLGSAGIPPIFSVNGALFMPPSSWTMNPGVTVESVNGRPAYHISGVSNGDHIDLWIRTDNYNLAKRTDHTSNITYTFTFTAWNSGATIALP